MVIVKPFFFNLILFHLLGKNNDVNMLDKFFLIVGVFADESNYLSFVKWKHGILSSINRDLNFWEKDQENVPRFKHIFTSVKNWIPTLPSGFYILRFQVHIINKMKIGAKPMVWFLTNIKTLKKLT